MSNNFSDEYNKGQSIKIWEMEGGFYAKHGYYLSLKQFKHVTNMINIRLFKTSILRSDFCACKGIVKKNKVTTMKSFKNFHIKF